MKKGKIKFGKSAATKSLRTVETKHTFGEGSTKEVALSESLIQAEEHMDWQDKNIDKLNEKIKEMGRWLAEIHNISEPSK